MKYLLLASLLLIAWLLLPARRLSAPSHLLINEAQWTVRYVDEFPTDPELMGWTDVVRHEVLLRRGMCIEQERDTLWHELHHAFMGAEFSDVKLNGHQMIYLMTPEELHIMRDNPQLVSYLTK